MRPPPHAGARCRAGRADGEQCPRLVAGIDGGEAILIRAGRRARARAAQPVDGEDRVTIRVERQAGSRELAPPAAFGIARIAGLASRGNAAKRRDHGRTGRTHQAPGDDHPLLPAVGVEAEPGDAEQAVADGGRRTRCWRPSGRSQAGRFEHFRALLAARPSAVVLRGARWGGSPAGPALAGGLRPLICRGRFSVLRRTWHRTEQHLRRLPRRLRA